MTRPGLIAPPPPEAIAGATAAAIGAPLTALRWRWLGAREGPTSLWWVDGGAAAVVVKVFWRGRGFVQERAALLGLRVALGRWLPELVAVIEGPIPALVLGAVAGARPGREDDAAARGAHFEAGRMVRALVEVAVDAAADPMPLGAAIAARAAAALERARGRVAPELLAAAGRRLDPGRVAAAFSGADGGARRVMAHRDLWEGNWLFDQVSGRLWVIDWEHARPDAAMCDRARLAAGAWARAPRLRVAFEAGFGAKMSELEEAQLEVLLGLHALATLAWAGQHPHAAALGADARRVLQAP
jgi:hypothetical protein